jgi:hypothetical protein
MNLMIFATQAANMQQKTRVAVVDQYGLRQLLKIMFKIKHYIQAYTINERTYRYSLKHSS